ncbi:hypothetical protein [Sphaerisporangium album]|uniref:hypothetical protein n=1 Tax=Sphaerisporangium album TaxID=509200 RepID=UPI0015F00352|nr:hypothetical protein [Sphaerisporangium album]
MIAALIAVLFFALAVATAMRGFRKWQAGDEDGWVTAIALSTGAIFIAIFTVLLGAAQ